MAEREKRPGGAGMSTAAAAAEQVRAIVEAAERSAASVETAAREEAERIREEAEADVAAIREGAERLAERAEELERRLGELAEGVRTAVDGLKEELDALRTRTTDAAPEPAGEATVERAGEAGSDVDPTIAETEAVAAREPEVADSAEEEAPAVGAEEEAEAAAPEGARVLALKMALDGTPREETARYLRENFKLGDPDALLDEVYAKAGG
jgi:hypothetical protein